MIPIFISLWFRIGEISYFASLLFLSNLLDLLILLTVCDNYYFSIYYFIALIFKTIMYTIKFIDFIDFVFSWEKIHLFIYSINAINVTNWNYFIRFSEFTFIKFLLLFRYNRIWSFSSDIEMSLVEDEVNAINELIKFGQENYNWNSPGIKTKTKQVYNNTPWFTKLKNVWHFWKTIIFNLYICVIY